MDAVALKLKQAYTQLICNHPFFASLLLKLTLVREDEDSPLQTMWTDGTCLGYKPSFVDRLTSAELLGVLAHEVAHVAGLHMYRREERDPRRWNIACDAVVNALVLDAGFQLPEGGVPPIPHTTPEALYNQMPEPLAQYMAALGTADGQDGEQDGGGGGAPPPGPFDEVLDARKADGTKPTREEMTALEAEARVNVVQAALTAQRAGKLPAGLKRFVDEVVEPRVPWREILSRFIDGNHRCDYAWIRPNRRYVNDGLLFPSLHSPGYGEVVLACDTSGSISQDTLRQIASEVLGCLEVYQERGQTTELTVAWCDTAVSVQQVSDAEDLNPVGGGGTSFAPVMEWLATREPQPRALIYVTDGYCNDFGEAPALPVLWILTFPNDSFKPPFGDIAYTFTN